jgi:glutathione S-transferase
MKLVDAPRCPYCARVRIALAEKRLEFEAVEVDLGNRPQWLLELNPPNGRVPVLDGLPESEVIMEYFDELLGRDYYAFRRGDDNDLAAKLERLEVGQSLFADVAYVPWVIRARDLLGLELPERLAAWLAGLEQRPSVAAEVELVRAL